jgi:hypothetical protein
MSIDVLVTVHPEPLAAAGLTGGSDIELRACVGFPDHDHVRLTFHGPQDRLDAMAAALSGGSVTLPAEPPARETAKLHEEVADPSPLIVDFPDASASPPSHPDAPQPRAVKRRGRPRKNPPAA